MLCPILQRMALVAGALAMLGGLHPGLAQNASPAAPPSIAVAPAQSEPEPSRAQLETQINILKDYIAKLKENAEKQSANLNASIDKLKADLAAATADPTLTIAQKTAQLRELQYAKEKFDIVVDGYWEQRIANRVALLLVVLMVTAGIAFSALQLWKAVNPKMPPAGKATAQNAGDAAAAANIGAANALAASDLEISAGKIRVTSTVVGVIVLLISIAFFYIYMKDLTSIRVVGDQGSSPAVSAR